MSTLWTPSGEHQVPDDQPQPGAAGPNAGGPDMAEADMMGPGPGGEPLDPEVAEQMRQAQEQLIQLPTSQVVANHIIGFFELALLHLRRDPPALDQARLPIDAMTLLVTNLGSAFEPEITEALTAALQQIQNAFVSAQAQVDGSAGAGGDGNGNAGGGGGVSDNPGAGT